MNAEIVGTQPVSTNEKNPQVNHEKVASSEQEFMPDRPPHPVEAMTETQKTKRPRGFAAMDRELVSEIARKGGKAAHSAGTAHEFTSDEARAAGRKGGRATHAKRRKDTEDRPEPSVVEQPAKSEG